MKTSVEDTGKGRWRHFGGGRKESEVRVGYVSIRSNQTIPNPFPFVARDRPTESPNMSDCLVPGQPVPLPRGPTLQLGTGVYTRNGETRASLLGTPQFHGPVGLSFLFASGSTRTIIDSLNTSR